MTSRGPAVPTDSGNHGYCSPPSLPRWIPLTDLSIKRLMKQKRYLTSFRYITFKTFAAKRAHSWVEFRHRIDQDDNRKLTLWFLPGAGSPGCPRCGRSSPCWRWRPGAGGRDPCGWCSPAGCGPGPYSLHGGPVEHRRPPAGAGTHSSSDPGGC